MSARTRSPPPVQAQLPEAEAMIQVMPVGWGRDNPAFRQFFATLFLPEGTPEQHRWLPTCNGSRPPQGTRQG